MRPLHAEGGCPFAITDDGMVPLLWFLDQGVSRRDLVRVLHSMFINEKNCSSRAIDLRNAWNLLDELIYRDCIPGPIYPYSVSPDSASLGADSADNWGGFVSTAADSGREGA